MSVTVIDSTRGTASYFPVLAALPVRNIPLTIYTGNEQLIAACKENCTIKRRRGISQPKSFGDWFFFTLAAPVLWLLLMGRLILLASRKQRTLIFTGLTEKILLTPWARLLRFRVIWLEDEFYPPSFTSNIYSLWFRLCARMSELIATSHAIANHLHNDIKVPQRCVTVIGRIVNIDHIKQQTDLYENMVQQDYQVHNKALFVIGFIGELETANGVEYLLKAIEYFKELIPHFQIIIVGDGPQKKSLMWLSKMLRLDTHIRFVGNQDNIQRWYNYFNVLVYPRTQRLAFATTVAEAMSAGIPVVTFDVDGVREVVNHQGGMVVPVGATERMAEAIFQLYNSTEVRERFALQGKQRIAKLHSEAAVIEAFTAHIRNIKQKSSAARRPS